MKLIKIGIIDDLWQEDPLTIRMANHRLEKEESDVRVVLIELIKDIDKMVESIILSKCDGLIIDQKLNSKVEIINYTGTDITKKMNKIKNIPYSFWTSVPDEVKDLCKSNEVDSIYNHNQSEENKALIKTDMFKRLVRKIKKYQKEIKEKEERLLYLLSIDSPTQDEITEIDFLDEELERSIILKSPLNKEARNLKIEKINDMIDNFFSEFKMEEK